MTGARKANGWQQAEAAREREISARSTVMAHQRLNPGLMDQNSADYRAVATTFKRLVASGLDPHDVSTEAAACEVWASGRPQVQRLAQPRPETFQDGGSGGDDAPGAAPASQLSEAQRAHLEGLAAKGIVSPAQASRVEVSYRR